MGVWRVRFTIRCRPRHLVTARKAALMFFIKVNLPSGAVFAMASSGAMLLTDTDLHCADLGVMENGNYKVTGDHFGARVMYSCDDGFWMSGPKERVCQGDGSWSERSPECRQKAMCGVPPQVPHARHNASEKVQEFDVDDVVQYTCFQGYDPQGYPRAKCLFFNGTTQWYGLDLRCIHFQKKFSNSILVQNKMKTRSCSAAERNESDISFY
ncbi:Protein lev-9 [Araneus ventricosus]|uniref:Protein lev-9 n=1 Tax=Araneus ventricosus TaxID=182803 RepID=A0A4Y2CGH3_ARAVE|nr:Protein lev-9 [Araneus ventricosus]